ncbi:glycogen-binding domain-containing protein [Gracilimonas sp. Q87]|uniref:glycogen-binding domain-containing protein n=1 Tax=Gracilimonas sp. Q87 TaxID=3384766 RepID=UPI0039844CD1
MRFKFVIMLMIGSILPISSNSQDVQTTITSEFRVGYSTNTYLNPFFSEWNRTYDSGYGLNSTFGQLFWDKNKHKFELNGGYVYQPFLSEQPTWHGYLAYGKYLYDINQNFNAGLIIGTTAFQSDFKRNLSWVQPYVTWFPSSYTSFNFKIGSNFTDYVNLQDRPDVKNRFNSYSLEFERWFNFRWQLKAGIYGNLDNLSSPQNGLSTSLSLGHSFLNGIKLSSEIQFINYSTEYTTIIDGGSGPGGPFTPPGGTTSETQSIDDQIWRLKFEGTYPVSKNISAFVSADRLLYQSSSLETGITDIQISGGFRLSFAPNLNSPQKNIVEPKWNLKDGEYLISIKYRGEGNLYVIGDFNDWERPGIPLRKTKRNKYVTTLKLDPGIYEYRILVKNGNEEKWLKFSNDISTVNDSFGGVNALKIVD